MIENRTQTNVLIARSSNVFDQMNKVLEAREQLATPSIKFLQTAGIIFWGIMFSMLLLFLLTITLQHLLF